jgi:hypothetical protein
MELKLVDYRELVRFMANHTAGKNDLHIKVQTLQKSYNRREQSIEQRIKQKLNGRNYYV